MVDRAHVSLYTLSAERVVAVTCFAHTSDWNASEKCKEASYKSAPKRIFCRRRRLPEHKVTVRTENKLTVVLFRDSGHPWLPFLQVCLPSWKVPVSTVCPPLINNRESCDDDASASEGAQLREHS